MEITGLPAPVFCGVGWAGAHHDIALVDASRRQPAKARISDDAAGFALLAGHGSSEDTPIPVAIKTSRGLLSRVCGPPAEQSSRSIHWRSPIIGTATPSRARSRTPPTPRPWPISCEPTWPSTARCQRTPSSSRPSPRSPRPIRTPSGPAVRPTTNFAPGSESFYLATLDAFAQHKQRPMLEGSPQHR